ncbi:unnamed protein product [Acanthosepion pharaonis]|uniref:Uncharacterized protein n=1 Tax=Acanthosepion pharaonis TaxID=158019 RepID=A0A812B4Z7_ACAPH|nr:unnamed protein product [Sepia pharaonis]
MCFTHLSDSPVPTLCTSTPVCQTNIISSDLVLFLVERQSPLVSREICCLHPSEGCLGVPSIEIRQHMLRITFLDRMCRGSDEVGAFWKEDIRKHFPSLRSVHSCEEEAGRTPRAECSFYRECRRALKLLLRASDGLSNAQALYRLLVRGGVQDDLIGELGLTKQEARSIWPWAPVLNNNSITMRHHSPDSWALWVGKRLCSAGLEKYPNCRRCTGEVETIGDAFFQCRTVMPLCKFVEGLMFRMLQGNFFVLEASSVCSNVVPQLTKAEHYVFCCLLGVMRVVMWTTRQKEFYDGEQFTSSQLILYFKHQLKVKIRTERRRLPSSEFGKRWVNLARLCRVKVADLEWHFHAG